MSDIYFKIRRTSDGLYSVGGTEPEFNSIGKVWKRKQDLLAHLKLVDQDFNRYNNKATAHPYGDCKLVVLKTEVVAVYDDINMLR